MSIWQYKEIKTSLNTSDSNLITLNEGNTPLEYINDENFEIFIKREDKNPTRSWKDRGTAFKISQLKNLGVKIACLTSSGNAAISYLEYAKLYPVLKLFIIVSPNINEKKRELLNDLIKGTHHELIESKFPKKTRSEIISKGKSYNLASSIDSEIIKGYWSLGFELEKLIKDERRKEECQINLFVPVSSGTALVGLVQGLIRKLENEYEVPHTFVCQTTKVAPIAETLGHNFESEESKADAIIERNSLRTPQILKIINETNGDALAISNQELDAAKDYVARFNIKDLTYTSLLSIAGALRLKALSLDVRVKNICIGSGR